MLFRSNLEARILADPDIEFIERMEYQKKCGCTKYYAYLKENLYEFDTVNDTVNDTVYTEEDLLNALYEGWESGRKGVIWSKAKKQFKESLKESKE